MSETAHYLLAEIERLAPSIGARSAEIEQLGYIPADIVDELRRIGIFRMFVPRERGGLELDFPDAAEAITALGRIDGSIGWTAMIGGGSSMFTALLPKDLYDDVYRHGPDVAVAGSAFLSGTAEATAGGWKVTGRWPFASGCLHADWILGLCVMQEDGKPIAGAVEGTPLTKAFVLPASEWDIEDSWHVIGLQGTGSRHVTLQDTFVPAGNFFDLRGPACLSGPLYNGIPQLIPLLHAANNLGMAEAAMKEVVALATTGHRQQRASGAMRDSEVFQLEIGRIQADIRAARAFLRAQVASHWDHALAGTLATNELLVEGAQMATWVTATCVRIVDSCYALGGSTAIYETSALQRQLRDIHTAAQHGMVQQRMFITGGALVLDQARQREA